MTASPALVHAVGDRALTWLDANREQFRLTPGDRENNQALLLRLKPVAELTINTHVLFREGVAGSRQRARAGALLDFTWREILDGGNILAGLQHDEPHSPVPLELYATFHELGYRHPGLERAIAAARSTACWSALEILPNRRLGILNAERRVGLTPSEDMEAALRRTWLGRTPEPWLFQYHIAYDVTHTVFHITNWGQVPDRIPPDIADYLARYLPAWLDDWADLEHWDLLGELLVVDGCIPRPGLDPAIWERYAAAQSASGAMPVHHAMPEGDPVEVFDIVHHSTLVAAFASAMATSRAMAAA
ncbi:DUF6895 family protein [Streptomyces sp. NPDC050560]|uniref:DUF6895 family protein n=1 Tax=Streptomyces sp. NPDC050560 TaxID=3365630 RepID=UPI0037BC512A